MIGQYANVKIQGISTVVPKQILDNISDYEDIFKEKQLKKQVKVTGIKTRRYTLEEETTAELSIRAIEILLEKVKWDKKDIDALILVTQTPNFVLPSTAFYIQQQLNIGKECLCFDMNLGCSGYIVGLQTVAGILQGLKKDSKKAILVVADTLTKYIDKTDLSTSLIFGDAATATAVEIEDNNIMYYAAYSDGKGYNAIFKDKDDYLKMDGPKVFEFTINQVVDGMKEFGQHFKLDFKDIDYYVFHQAQKFIIDNITSLLELEEDKVLISYNMFGNTAGASIPLTLCHNQEILQNKQNIKVLLSGFGVGLSWGYTYLTLDTTGICGINGL